MRHLAHHRGLLRHLWWLVALVVLMMTIYVVVAREVMKQVPDWRGPLEELVQNQTQLPLTIGRMSGHMEGLTPVFVLEEVQLQSPGQADALKIDRVTVAADLLMSALHRSIWLRELKISGLDIEVRQQPDNHFQLVGFPRTADSAQPQNASLQGILKLLYQQKLVILDDVRLRLSLKDVPDIVTHRARLEMQSSGSQHQLALRLQTQGHPVFIEARLALTKSVYDYTDLNGKAYLAFEGDELAYWLTSAWPGEVRPTRLAGRLGVWLTLAGGQLSLAQVTAGIDQLTLSDGKADWSVSGLDGQFAVQRRSDGYHLQVEALDFDSSAGHWSSGRIAGQWQGTDPATAQWALSLTDVDLSRLVKGIVNWPFALPDEVLSLRDKLLNLRPEAKVNRLHMAGQGRDVLQFSGQLAGVGILANGKVPGVQGLNVRFAGSASEGIALVTPSQLVLDFPDLYEQTVEARLSGGMHWQTVDDTLILRTNRWQIDSEDGQGELMAGLILAPGQLPRLQLLADISSQQAAHADRYIPYKKMPDGLSHWLRGAVSAGQVPLGRFLVEGPVRTPADRHQERTFQMQFTVDEAELRFLEGWPHLTGLAGSVLIDHHQVMGKNISGLFYDSPFAQTSVDVQTHDGKTELAIHGQIDGKAQDVSRLFHETPLTRQLPQELADWQLAVGSVTGDLQLDIVLQKGADVRSDVRVNASVQDAVVSNKARRLSFDDVAGQVHFGLTEGITVDQLTGRWLGEPFTGQVHRTQDAIVLTAAGQVGATALAKWLEADWLNNASGQTDAGVSLLLPWKNQRPVELAVTSDLQGLAIELPAPFAKQPHSKAPLSLSLINGEQLRFQYDGLPAVSGRLQMQAGEVRSGIIRAGREGPAALPVSKVLVDVAVPELDAAKWMEWIRRQPLAGGKASKGFPLQQMQVDIGTLALFGLTLADARLVVAPADQDGWQFSVASAGLEGSVLLPDQYDLRGSRPLVVDIKQINLPDADENENKASPLKGLSPLEMPVADVTVAQLDWGKQKVSGLQGKVRPLEDGVQVEALKGSWRHADFSGLFDWRETSEGQRSRYQGKVITADLKRLQRDLGFDEVVVSDEKAEANVDVSWAGHLLDFDYQALTGQGNFRIRSCRLPGLDKNSPLMRLLGALNVGSISRRLRFDFSDIYKKGFSCDGIRGDLQFADTQLGINSLHLKSPSADISLEGSANLADQTVDSNATVVLPLSSNLYAGCLAGPAACAGIFVFERLLGDKLEKAVALHYHLSGNWFEPTIKETK